MHASTLHNAVRTMSPPPAVCEKDIWAVLCDGFDPSSAARSGSELRQTDPLQRPGGSKRRAEQVHRCSAPSRATASLNSDQVTRGARAWMMHVVQLLICITTSAMPSAGFNQALPLDLAIHIGSICTTQQKTQ